MFVIPPPPSVGEAGISIERRCTYVHVCVYTVCNNFTALRHDPRCSSTLVVFVNSKVLCASVECTVVEALEAATLHPAQLLRIEKSKGTLDFGSDADFVLLDSRLNVRATYIAGKLVWKIPDLTLPEISLDVK